MSRFRFKLSAGVLIAAAFALAVLAACGGTERVVETVIVKEPGQVITEKVVETVIVEKSVQVVATPTPGAMVMEPEDEESAVTVADSSVFPVIFVHALSGLGQEWKVIGWDVGENLLRVDGDGNYDPEQSIARAFEVSPDNTSITFQLRNDVMFHQTPGGAEVGPMTAEDVAWSFNNSGRGDSIFYRAGSVRDWMGEFDEDGNRTVEPFDVLDTYTVRLNWKTGKFLPVVDHQPEPDLQR